MTNKVSESNNPTNNIELKADSDGSTSYSYVQLVGGRGNAVGENKPKPTWGIPNESPIVEIPELNINDVPLLPPTPILDKPYLPIEDVPILPPAPILELPELKIELPKFEEPKKEEPKENPKEEPKHIDVKYNKEYVNEEAQLPNTGESSSHFGLLVLLTLFTSVILYKKASKSY